LETQAIDCAQWWSKVHRQKKTTSPNLMRRLVARKRNNESRGAQARKEHGQGKQPGELPHSCFLSCPLL